MKNGGNMANNNSYEKFYSVKKTKLNDVTSSFECSVNIDSTENISKILAVSVSSGLPQTEALTGEANISGNALVTIVYLTESGLVGNATYCSPYSLKVQNSEITPNAQVLARVTNVDSKVTALNGSTAQVQYEVTLKVYVVSKIEVPYLSETTDDICSTTEDVTYQSLAGTCRNNWMENIEVSVKEPIKQVISTTSDVHLTTAEASEGFVTLCATLISKITYVTDTEAPQIKTVYNKTEVKQEVECEYAKKGSLVDVVIDDNSCEVKTTVTENGEEVKLSITIPLDVFMAIYSINTVTLTSDLFSTENVITSTTQSYENTVSCEPIVFDKKIEGSLVLSDEEPRIDKLLAVNYSKAVITNEYIDGGTYNLSGVLTSNLIYFNDEESRPNSVDVEIPFVVSYQTDIEGDVMFDTSVTVCDVDVMVKKGRDVYVDAVLLVHSNICRTTQGAVISNIETSEQLPEKDCAIEIYFGKVGEKIWDIAKKLFIRPELIYRQNPSITEDVLGEDTRIALYYQKTQK